MPKDLELATVLWSEDLTQVSIIACFFKFKFGIIIIWIYHDISTWHM